MSQCDHPGYGLGLRPCHYEDLLTQKPAIDWLEVMTEDFMVDGGAALYYLDQLCQLYPVALHGVSLSIGGTDPFNQDYLQRLKTLRKRTQAMWISDHLCWTGVGGINLHDLMPLPYNAAALKHVVERILYVQDFLGERILIENISSYVRYKESTMTEWDFLAAIAEKADCYILLDINNIYVNSYNHQFDPQCYLANLPSARVKQFHLAGYLDCGTHIIDTHDTAISPQVWHLYAKAAELFDTAATLIERDANIPALSQMLLELNKAREVSCYENIA